MLLFCAKENPVTHRHWHMIIYNAAPNLCTPRLHTPTLFIRFYLFVCFFCEAKSQGKQSLWNSGIDLTGRTNERKKAQQQQKAGGKQTATKAQKKIIVRCFFLLLFDCCCWKEHGEKHSKSEPCLVNTLFCWPFHAFFLPYFAYILCRHPTTPSLSRTLRVCVCAWVLFVHVVNSCNS